MESNEKTVGSNLTSIAVNPVGMYYAAGGMSLRDYFAAKALSHRYTGHDADPGKAAEWAYQLADAMLAAREAKS